MRFPIGGVALLLALGTTARAQAGRATLSMSAGTETDALGVTSRAATIEPTLAVAVDRRLTLGLDGGYTRYDNQQWAANGGATAAARVPFGDRTALTADAGGLLGSASYGFSYSMARLLPAVEVRAGNTVAYLGANAAYATTRISLPTTTRPNGVPGLFGSGQNASGTRATPITDGRLSRNVVVGGNTRLRAEDGSALVISARDERGRTDSIATADDIVSLSVIHGIATIGAAVGLHSALGARRVFGNGSLSVALSRGASLDLNAGTYPDNPLLGTAAGRYVTLGLSLRTGASSRTGPHLPAARGVPAVAAGFTRLTFRDASASSVEVAGDFTNWNVIAARPSSDGVWFVDLRIPPGQYRYEFRVNGTAWRIPEGAPVVDDDFGGKAAWLTVSDAPTGSVR
jgi:hypothetical protein